MAGRGYQSTHRPNTRVEMFVEGSDGDYTVHTIVPPTLVGKRRRNSQTPIEQAQERYCKRRLTNTARLFSDDEEDEEVDDSSGDEVEEVRAGQWVDIEGKRRRNEQSNKNCQVNSESGAALAKLSLLHGTPPCFFLAFFSSHSLIYIAFL